MLEVVQGAQPEEDLHIGEAEIRVHQDNPLALGRQGDGEVSDRAVGHWSLRARLAARRGYTVCISYRRNQPAAEALVAELRGVTHHRLPGEAPARDWPARLHDVLVVRLRRRGLEPRPAEGPIAFIERAAAALSG